MADWSKPTLTSTYANYLAETTGRDVDCATQFSTGTPTNVPTGSIKWDSSLKRWQIWSGTAWGELTTSYQFTGVTCTSFTNSGDTTLGDSSADNVVSNAANWTFVNATTIAGTITYTGAVSFNGNVTLGDASTDTVTLKASTVSIPNNVNFSGGNVGFGTSSQINSSYTSVINLLARSTNGIALKSSASAWNAATFFNSAGTLSGYIMVSGTTTSYVTSSDKRLKTNIVDSADAGSIIDAIKVREFDWVENGQHEDYGFIAQELQPLVPNAVHCSGSNPNGLMGVDYSKLVPMLVKEIQTLRARVAALEAA